MPVPKRGFAICVARGLAFVPVLFLMGTVGAAEAASSGSGDSAAQGVHNKVANAEALIVKAISAGNAKALGAAGSSLGPIIEAAIAKRERGTKPTSCELAAHSLAFLAVSAAQALGQGGEPRRVLLDDAQAAATDFRNDMRACESYIGRQTGSHTSAEKALKAL